MTTTTITKRATITFYKPPTVTELVQELQKLPDEWHTGRVTAYQSDSQRDGTTITFTIDAGSLSQ
ncbi:Uncharacterised protein [Mycobacteroides abscessus subsp. abscessus]|uniref:hypothetical protein n=1 Tax=Mycobacteroides abscessus TaxID=36809 RepID=UPI0009A7459E|nr:hypothetical protein [Mycobacteroides abscessus]SKR27683.1 Uncharacterised protein [Mycobacteroides abscessus subsp. abscessus]